VSEPPPLQGRVQWRRVFSACACCFLRVHVSFWVFPPLGAPQRALLKAASRPRPSATRRRLVRFNKFSHRAGGPGARCAVARGAIFPRAERRRARDAEDRQKTKNKMTVRFEYITTCTCRGPECDSNISRPQDVCRVQADAMEFPPRLRLAFVNR
jgi:hypothetical protein